MINILTQINSNPTFVDVLQKRLELSGDKKAFTFLQSEGNISLTFFELDRKIRRVAAFLQQQNLKGERALLLYPPGLDYIIGYFGCLYAGVIAVPVYPPDSSRLKKTLPRIQSIIKDSGAKIALSSQNILDDVDDWKNELIKDETFDLGNIFDLKWIATDNLEEKNEDDWINPNLSADFTAYLQYTSGSTGTPKGVIINHTNLVHNTNMIFSGFNMSEDTEGVIWLPIYHDMGLIGGILEPIFSGSHCSIMSPIDFLKRPFRWLQTISDIKDVPVASGGPNFAFELCFRATNPQKAAELDLSNWDIAFSGAEPIRAETINKFSEKFSVSGFKKKSFYPCYGLAEGTLIVSGCNHETEPVEISIDKEELKKNKVLEVADIEASGLAFISSGSQLLDGKIEIVNPDTKALCPENEVGEIWALSPSNAQGYYKHPELSEETFQAFTSDSNEGPFLRTGDLGFMQNGKLFVTGRLKDLVIVNGSNHYPQDIEETVETANKLLRPGSTAAFSVDIDNEEKLVVVQEARAKQNVNWGNVVKDIRNEVFEVHNIHAYDIVLIKPHTIFKTSSGKIRRRDTKNAYLDKKLEIIFQSNNLSRENDKDELEIEVPKNNDEQSFNNKELVETISNRISKSINLPVSKIDINQPFVSYGIDSAKAIGLVGEIEEYLGRKLAATLLWDYPTIQKLADYLAGNSSKKIEENKETKTNGTNKEFIDEVKELTEEEAEALLMKKLGLD